MAVLSAYVRENARWEPAQTTGSEGGRSESDERAAAPAAVPRPRVGIQAALTVISRREARAEPGLIDLREAILSGADLIGSDLIGSGLIGADLRDATLFRADLSGADLSGANLLSAKNLTKEQLADAIVDEHTKLPDYLRDDPGVVDERGER